MMNKKLRVTLLAALQVPRGIEESKLLRGVSSVRVRAG